MNYWHTSWKTKHQLTIINDNFLEETPPFSLINTLYNMINPSDYSLGFVVLFQLVHIAVLAGIIIGMLKALIYFDNQGDQGKMIMMKVLIVVFASLPLVLPAVDALFTSLRNWAALVYSYALIPSMIFACALARIWWKKNAPVKQRMTHYI